MMIDDQDDDLILSMSRLGFSKQSSLLGCCKVPYGCQAHLSEIMKVVFSCKMTKMTRMTKMTKVTKVTKVTKMAKVTRMTRRKESRPCRQPQASQLQQEQHIAS